MFQGLSLDQAPPYNIPLRFYITAGIYLIILTIVALFFGLHVNSRHDYEAIALTHLLTLGFFSHIMIGSMFQMIPVMLGVAYKDVVKRANIIYGMLNVGTILFFLGFFLIKIPLIHLGGTLLALAIIFFSIISLQSVLESVEKDFLVQNFLAAFSLFLIGAIFGFIAVLGQSGIFDATLYGDIHLSFMLFGWIFVLINAVSYKIIPMFFVAKEFPDFIKKYLYIFMTTTLIVLALAKIIDLTSLYLIAKFLLGLGVVLFALYSIYLLKNRKRARRDISVDLWYFSMINITIASLLVLFNDYIKTDISNVIGFFALFGGAYALINAMLYKIVPFLTWFHLSSNMVFEAEMNDVIKKTDMKLQVNLYFISYLLFTCKVFWNGFFILGNIVFLLSSLLLLRNLVNGSLYYKEYIKKKIDISNFS
ncbi:MAG: hypothetical protein GXO11_05800 [Epsilonproteobacteria bacterium]|nr:hypothetical protein [Campylobacterota bacterium]